MVTQKLNFLFLSAEKEVGGQLLKKLEPHLRLYYGNIFTIHVIQILNKINNVNNVIVIIINKILLKST